MDNRRCLTAGSAARKRLCGIVLAACGVAISGCAVNPSTGRNQLIALPAAQIAHANFDFTLSAAAQGLVPASPCTRRAAAAAAAGTTGQPGEAACPGAQSTARFAHQVRRMQAELTAEAQILAPEVFDRIAGFDIRIESDLGAGSASSAGGRIVLDAGLAALNPTDDVVAFVIAREMGHVIARHGEENSGAKMAFSALTAIIPGAALVRFAASMLGAGVLKASWAEGQRREADELAMQLLAGSGRPARVIALNLQSGLTRRYLPAGDWGRYFEQSMDRVAALALQPPVPDHDGPVLAALVDVQEQTR